MKAVVKRTNNIKYPTGTEVQVEHVYSKFYSQTFGTFFLVRAENENGILVDYTCRERRCELLRGGEWELKED